MNSDNYVYVKDCIRYRPEYDEVYRRLQGFFLDAYTIDRWLASPNLYLRGETPLYAINTGRGDKVVEILEALR